MFRRGGKTTAISSGGRRKLHTTFGDGTELIEEYDLTTDELISRRRRRKTTLGKQSDWEWLYGDPPQMSSLEMRESTRNPTFTRLDTRELFQWRVRNLPYPADVFQLSIDQDQRQVVIRTTIKKYFKRFHVPELDMLQLPMDPNRLQWHHANNTLVVSYVKPPEVLAAEAEDLAQRKAMANKENGDVDCKQQ